VDGTDTDAGIHKRWVLLILLASAPLLLAVALLQLLGPPAGPLSPTDLAMVRGAATESYLAGAISYAGITTIHFFACAAAIFFALLVMKSAANPIALAAIGLGMGLTVAALMLLLGRLWGDSILLYRLTFFSLEELYRGTGVETWLVADGPGLNVLGLAIYLPTLIGVFAVSLTAAAATGQLGMTYGRFSQTDEEQEALLCLAHSRIKRCAYALSFVLVTSTVAASLFFQLPGKLELSAAGEPKLAAALAVIDARIDAYGAEMTMFWGAVYSLTLFAAVGIPLLFVQKEVRDFLDGLKPPERAEPVIGRLKQAGVVSAGGEQIKMLVAFVAPLVSAPVASFLQTTTG
jgi:hypothetical protein